MYQFSVIYKPTVNEMLQVYVWGATKRDAYATLADLGITRAHVLSIITVKEGN
jgi:hypothetical protein